MPIYEYGCTKCGFQLEKLQKLNDQPLTDCPSCSKAALRKKISAGGFRLKGSGWYETDFKQGNKKNIHDSGETKKPADSGETKKSADSSETKKPADSGASGKSDTGKKDSSSTTAKAD